MAPPTPWQAGDRWQGPTATDRRGGDSWGPMMLAYQRMMGAISSSAPPEDALADLTAQFNQIATVFEQYAVPEEQRFEGRRPDLPSRGKVGFPTIELERTHAGTVSGTVTFGRMFLGGNGAVHGGLLPLVFDEVLGVITNGPGQRVARTAYLTTQFRIITPVDVPLTIRASVDKVEGRKRWASGQILDAQDRVLSEAEGLFIELRDDQP